MNKELKRGPFCGSTRLSVKSKKRKANLGMYSVRCNVCKARGGTVDFEAEAEKIAGYMWNRRANDGKID